MDSIEKPKHPRQEWDKKVAQTNQEWDERVAQTNQEWDERVAAHKQKKTTDRQKLREEVEQHLLDTTITSIKENTERELYSLFSDTLKKLADYGVDDFMRTTHQSYGTALEKLETLKTQYSPLPPAFEKHFQRAEEQLIQDREGVQKTYEGFKNVYEHFKNEQIPPQNETDLSNQISAYIDNELVQNGIIDLPFIGEALNVTYIVEGEILKRAKENGQRTKREREAEKAAKETPAPPATKLQPSLPETREYTQEKMQKALKKVLEDTDLKQTFTDIMETLKGNPNKTTLKYIMKSGLEEFATALSIQPEFKDYSIPENIEEQLKKQNRLDDICKKFCESDSNHPISQFLTFIIKEHQKEIPTPTKTNLTTEQELSVATNVTVAELQKRLNTEILLQQIIKNYPEISEKNANKIVKKVSSGNDPKKTIEDITPQLPEEERESLKIILENFHTHQKISDNIYQPDSEILYTIVREEASPEEAIIIMEAYAEENEEFRILYEEAREAEQAYLQYIQELREETVIEETDEEENEDTEPKIFDAETETALKTMGITVDQDEITRIGDEFTAPITYQDITLRLQWNPESTTFKIFDPENPKKPLAVISEQEKLQKGFIEGYLSYIFHYRKELPQEKLNLIQPDELAKFFQTLFPNIESGKKLNLRKGRNANIMPNLIHLLIHEPDQNRAIIFLTTLTRNNRPKILLALQNTEEVFKQRYPDMEEFEKDVTKEHQDKGNRAKT